ncbi:ATP-binding cassette domain-containing protein [Nonomuraea sp. MG754425]|uniref:ABC transporter ATP-binding protein n=1 Tax=Nonomuraea sp. MG754425 TaxID=2570319 RepID=UPI001F0143D5|nr:oligopeptide/dipeptide ABC transporter ATP-binding protein [Nonomuraea sp. MG754425]MCF6467850.1 ATP-binding cassette domain-containing protein [Nonomuraea sp. MG754425]
MPRILEVTGLKKHFPHRSRNTLPWRPRTMVKSVDGVDLDLEVGETLAIVGESGSGKTTLARTVLKLYEPTAGRIVLDGADITEHSLRRMTPIRRNMQMVFQDPVGSLNPRAEVAAIVEEPLRVQGMRPAERRRRVAEMLELVGLNPGYGSRYPHEFSGGQRQRIAIARALSVDPKLVVLDEPVSALDVSIQAQIINLLVELRRELSMSYLFISHDLGVVRQIADRIAVMYLGRIVEEGARDDVLLAPKHPYTQALLSAVPIDNPALRGVRRRRVLAGDTPNPANPPTGCPFRTRCWLATDTCATTAPELLSVSPTQRVSCHVATEPPQTR